jgi:hypothetical protein
VDDLENQRMQCARAASLRPGLYSRTAERSEPRTTSASQDLNDVVSTATTIASMVNDFAFQNEWAKVGIETANGISTLYANAVQGYQAYKNGEVSDPYYILSNIVSFAASVGRVVADPTVKAVGEGRMAISKETLDFVFNLTQVLAQFAKWGTRPSTTKAKGQRYDLLAESLQRTRSEIEESIAPADTSHSRHAHDAVRRRQTKAAVPARCASV